MTGPVRDLYHRLRGDAQGPAPHAADARGENEAPDGGVAPAGAAPVSKVDYRATYVALVEHLKGEHDHDRAMSLAVGGQFEAFGAIEVETLKHFGLAEDDYLVDVGCGSGRLSRPLADYLRGRYLGIDIVPELVDHARRITGRPDWRFETADGLSIPEADGVADMACFFSVFTHLLQEESYVYLRDAVRVLRPGGLVVFSFLEFSVDALWDVFEGMVSSVGRVDHPLNIFLGRDAVDAWAAHLGLEVVAVHRGDEPFITLPEALTLENGTRVEGTIAFGQSVCALRKPAPA
jgi:SAM-dependent methyltransferase